jgi:hypothetical protein
VDRDSEVLKSQDFIEPDRAQKTLGSQNVFLVHVGL